MNSEKFLQLFNAMNPEQHTYDFGWVVERVEALNPHVIVEVGVKEGGSLKFWEQIVHPADIVVGVDMDADVPNKIKWDWQHSDREVRIIVGDSTKQSTVEKVKDVLNGKQIDFLMLDGEHWYSAPEHDFENFAPLVRVGGGICVADLGASCASHVFNALPEPKDADPTAGMGFWWKRSSDIIQLPACPGDGGQHHGGEAYEKVLKKYHRG